MTERLMQASLAIPTYAGEVFLARHKRGPGIGFYNGYGGKREVQDEREDELSSNLACVVRETRTESGFEPKLEELFYQGSVKFFHKANPKYNQEVHIYTWVLPAPISFPESDEMEASEAFKITALPIGRMWPADGVLFPIILGGFRINAEVHFADDRSVDRIIIYDPAPPTGSSIVDKVLADVQSR